MPGSLVTLVTWVTYCSFWMTAQEIEDACVTGNFGNLGNFKSNNIRVKMDCIGHHDRRRYKIKNSVKLPTIGLIRSMEVTRYPL